MGLREGAAGGRRMVGMEWGGEEGGKERNGEGEERDAKN